MTATITSPPATHSAAPGLPVTQHHRVSTLVSDVRRELTGLNPGERAFYESDSDASVVVVQRVPGSPSRFVATITTVSGHVLTSRLGSLSLMVLMVAGCVVVGAVATSERYQESHPLAHTVTPHHPSMKGR